MMYLKIILQKEKSIYKSSNKTFLKRIMNDILMFFFAANPDYDNLIDDTLKWLLEFNDEESTVVREIGLDEQDNVIMKMPYKNNYGYWSDVDMPYTEYKKRFKYEIIYRNYFEKKWNELID